MSTEPPLKRAPFVPGTFYSLRLPKVVNAAKPQISGLPLRPRVSTPGSQSTTLNPRMDLKPERQSAFPPTRWSLVLAAQEEASETSRLALGELCEAYWHPLYAFVRHTGYNPQQSEDFVQGFFASLIARSSLDTVSPEKGKLRSFFLASLKKHIADVHRKESTAKRGGGMKIVPADSANFERAYLEEADSALTPDQLYDRRWAQTVLDRTMEKLGSSYEKRGKGDIFRVLKDHISWNNSDASYASSAAKLGMNENAVQQAVFRLRTKYRSLLEQEIAETVGDPGHVQAELDALILAFNS